MELKKEHFIELTIAFLLAFATLGTAWSGVQATAYSQAGAKRTESVRAYNRAGQFRLVDVIMVTEWGSAYLDGDLEKAEIYETRFRPELKVAFDAWQASDPADAANVSGSLLAFGFCGQF